MGIKMTPNKYTIIDSYAVFETSKGTTFIVDVEDIEKVSKYHWYVSPKGYIQAVCRENNHRYNIRLHRLLMDCPNGMVVDHINHNITDNRKCNLRVCTQDENMRNRKPDKNSKSGIKGVYPENGKWRVMISYNRKQYRLGTYSDIREAIKVRQKAEEYFYGAFANLQETEGIVL